MTDYYDSLTSESFSDPFAGAAAESIDFDANDAYDGLEAFDGLDDFDSLGEGGDEFFKKAFRRIGRSVSKLKFLRKLAPIAGRMAGGFIGGPAGAKIGGMIGGMVKEDEGFDGYDAFGGEAFDFEEFDSEDEDQEDEALQEDRAEAYGLDPLSDGLAEELAGLAADSESEADAAAMLGGVTIHIIAPAPIAVKRVSPVIVRSATRLGRFLRRSRRTRPLVKTIPTIQRRAVKMLTKQAQTGKPVTPTAARKAMAKATFKTLRSPRAATKGIANNVTKRKRLATINKKAIGRAER